MKNKNRYRVRNWKDYNKSLIARGSIEIWISKEALSNWSYQGKRKPGGIKVFSDLAIQACLLVKEVYRLSFRMCEGFMRSLSRVLGIKKVPNYTTLCRRMREINFHLPSQLNKKQALHVLIDSTGLKVYGQSEWYKKKHALRSYSLWSKLHVAMDHESQKILSVKRSDAHAYDSKYFGPLLNEIDDIKLGCIYGDGAYDKRLCYEEAYKHQAHLIAPVQKGARKQKDNRNYSAHEALIERDRQIDCIHQFETEEIGRSVWKIASRYHKRSLVETAMYRLKNYFGYQLECKNEKHQQKQMEIRAFALNIMTDLGMPVAAVS